MNTIIATNITKNYVPDWTVQDAMRELLQNAIDADPEGYSIKLVKCDNGDGTFEYACQITTGTLLPLESLYLGESGKRDDSDKLGVHGEGLKLAMLVLLREGREPDIHSEHYIFPEFVITNQAIEVLQFSCSKIEGAWEPDTTMIEFNCTEEEFKQFEQKHLPIGTPYGILADAKPDSLYVGGLEISSIGLNYSYNLSPTKIKLERDRRVADVFRVQEAIAELWIEHAETHNEAWDTIAEGMLKQVYDFEGFAAIEPPQPLIDAVTRIANTFDKPPIANYMSYSGYIGRHVPFTFYSVYQHNPNKRVATKQLEPADLLTAWFHKNRSYFRKAGKKRMAKLIEDAKKWRVIN